MHSSTLRSVLVGVLLYAWGPFPAFGAEDGTLTQCATIDDDTQRLACYDAVAGRVQAPSPERRRAEQAHGAEQAQATPPAEATTPDVSEPKTLSALSRHWELDREAKQGTFLLRLHKQNYFLPVSYSSNPNQEPSTPTEGTAPDRQLQNLEAKFQLSFKIKALERMLNGRADLWFAYTQQSQWQVYNATISRPFSETDYEPEVMMVFPVDYPVLGLHGRFVNLGLVHQSNGQSDPLSRSWNRVYAQFGLERGNLALYVRPWYRLPEKVTDDNNPDIEDYLGYGDLQAVYRSGGHTVSLLLRNNLRTDDKRGAGQLDYSFPLLGRLKGYFQLFTGYGASLIDYNHQQTTVGLGVLLSE